MGDGAPRRFKRVVALEKDNIIVGHPATAAAAAAAAAAGTGRARIITQTLKGLRRPGSQIPWNWRGRETGERRRRRKGANVAVERERRARVAAACTPPPADKGVGGEGAEEEALPPPPAPLMARAAASFSCKVKRALGGAEGEESAAPPPPGVPDPSMPASTPAPGEEADDCEGGRSARFRSRSDKRAFSSFLGIFLDGRENKRQTEE